MRPVNDKTTWSCTDMIVRTASTNNPGVASSVPTKKISVSICCFSYPLNIYENNVRRGVE